MTTISGLGISSTLGATLVVFLVLKLLNQRQNYRKLPPGPRKLPLIGNLLDMPSKLDAGVFNRMAKEHGSDIIHLSALGQSIVILNSLKVAQDLLDKRSSIYSSRPNSVMIRELCGFDWLLALRPYGERWRSERKSMTKYLEAKRQLCEERELFYARGLLQRLLEDPDNFLDHILYAVGSMIMSSVYGFKIGPNDPYIALAGKTVETVTNCVLGGVYLPDVIPLAKHLPSWLPGLQFPAIAEESRKVTTEFLNKPFDDARKKMMSGDLLPSIVEAGLDDITNSGDNNSEMGSLKAIAAALYLGGVDTSSAVLGFLLLAILKHPVVLKRVQEELDLVFQGRLPNHQDLQSLPYLTATVLEIYRWRPISPLALPHYLIEDDVYEDLYIPKGSTIIPNVEAMLHDESDYPEPHIFRPERFLRDGRIDDTVRNPMDILFGFGRRTCVGRERAHSTIMLCAASVLSVFTLEKKRNKNGVEIEPVEGFVEGVARFPLPFGCSIKPRSPVAADLVRAWTTATDFY